MLLSKNIPFVVKTDQSLSELSTFGIGGKARFYTEVTTIDQMQKVISFCFEENLRYFVLGKGSNCLFDDRGFNGLVIANKIDFLTIEKNEVTVSAGYSFARLGMQTAKRNLGGLEFAAGIPATVGGAVFMNAGANKQETADTLEQVLFIDETGKLVCFEKKDLEFRYRYSSFQEKKGAIVEATFHLYPDLLASKKQKEIVSYRLKTQPYKDKSIGCIFQNPGPSAGLLIEQCNLKGYQIGGAAVSSMHANFIINQKKASSKDVVLLIDKVKEEVLKQTGVEIHEEMQLIPYE